MKPVNVIEDKRKVSALRDLTRNTFNGKPVTPDIIDTGMSMKKYINK